MEQKEKAWVQAQYDARSAKEKDPEQMRDKQESAGYQRVINLATGHFYRQLATSLGAKPLTIVDLGCGQGADVHKMTNLAHLSRYYGFDLSANAIEAYKKRVSQHGRSDVDYYLQPVDLTLDPLPAFAPGSVDMVICKNALHFLLRPQLWKWIHSILCSGGVFAILCVNGQTLQQQVFDVINSKGRCDALPNWISFEREVSVREFLPIVESATRTTWDFSMITRFFACLNLPIEPSYRFSLRGLVTDVRERLLMPTELAAQGKQVGLRLDHSTSAWEMYEASQKKLPLEGMRGPLSSELAPGDVFVSSLYQFYSFRK